MNFFILGTVGLIYFLSNLIDGNETAKSCGGLNTEVTIMVWKNEITHLLCNAQRIDTHAVILPAYCIEGLVKKDLAIRNSLLTVSYIFFNPFYSHCSAKNDLAILVLNDTFDSQSDVICLENSESTESADHYECELQPITLLTRNEYYKRNGVEYGDCSSSKDHVMNQSGMYFTDFWTCSFYFNESSETIKLLQGFSFWGWDSPNEEASSFFNTTYKLDEVKDWLDQIQQHAVPVALNKSITPKEKDEIFNNLNIKYL